MAHALRYFCSWQSERYKHQMRLELWEKDYKGEATAMVLSGEPKLTMEEGETICGSSLDFGLLSETNGQYLHLYTTDNHKYLIKILRDSAVMWEGYLLPEYYSEAYIAAPYTVSFTATDWLGMLKNIDFPAEDTRVPILQIIKTCLQYTELPLDFACQLDMRVEGINDTTNVLGALYLNPMTFTGYNCYEVLEKILAAFNATLRQTGHRWLISSIDDELPLRLISWDSLSYTGDGQNNNGELIGTNFTGTFIDGSMTMAISPAKKSVDLSQDIFYRESWLKDYDFHSADAWELHGNILKRLPGWLYTKNPDNGQLIKQTYVEYLRVRPLAIVADNNYISQVINVEGAPDNSEFTLGIKFLTPTLLNGDNTTVMYVKIINRSSTSLTQDVAYLSVNGWTNEDSEIELNGTSTEPEYLNSRAYYDKDGNLEWALKKDNWPITKINFISIPYSGTLEIRIRLRDIAIYEKKHPLNPQFSHYFGGVYLTRTNVTKNLTISSTLNPDAAETASSVNLMLCDSPEERNVELGVLNYFSLSDGTLTTGKKWYYNGQEYEDFLHAITYSYSRCYANKRQKLSGALYTDKIYNLCSFTDKWSGKRHTIKSWIYSIISERLDSMEIIETPAKEIELTLSTPEAGSSNKQNQPSGGTSGGGATSTAGSGRYVNLDTAQEVSGEKTWNDNANFKKNINVAGDGIFGGEVVAIAGDAEPAGVTNYAQLQGKPSINGKELASGNNTLDALGIQPKGDYTTASQLATTLENYATKVFVSNNYAGKSAFNNHTADTDIHITAAERAAWNAKWDYNEATIKAVKVTSASSADSVSWSGISGKPTTFTPSAHTHNASEISGLPTNLSAFTNDVGYITGITKSMVEGVLTGDITSHTHTFASLTSKPTTIAGYGITDAITTGNIGSQSVNYANSAGDADTLDDLHAADFAKVKNYIVSGTDINSIGYGITDDGNMYYGPMATFGTVNYFIEIQSPYNKPELYYRQYNTNGYSGKKQIAFTDSNVASATKLQTPRSIWGQSFDGSADVSGDLEYVGNISASGKATIQGDIISGGEVVAVAGEGTPAGVTDYSALTGKPSINGVTLASGNNTLDALGIQPKGDYTTASQLATTLENYATKVFVSNNYAGKSAFNNHTADTDIHITAAERAAWNAKWDYNEATIKAVKVTSASSADSVSWSGISGKPTTFTPSAHTHTASEVSGLPTSLKNPYAVEIKANGVSLGTYDGSAVATFNLSAANVGAANKVHTHTASDISGLPTNLSAFTNDVGYITGITKSMVEGVLTGNITSHTHTFASLTSKPTTIAGYGITDAITTGNIGSQSVNYANSAGDADTLDDLHAADFAKVKNHIVSGTDINSIGYGITDDGNMYYGPMATFGTVNYFIEIQSPYNKPELYYRQYNTNGYSGKKQIAFTDSNVASATKLQTPRSIWGQSFDGTGNVSGGITTCDYIQNNDQTGGFFVGSRISGLGDKAGGLLLYVYGQRKMSFYTNSENRIEISTNGNILIGTTTDNGYKLQVNGSTLIDRGNNGGVLIGRNGNTIDGYANGSLTELHLNYVSPSNISMCSGGGNVGIGTGDPKYKLDINGAGHYSGDLIVDGEVSALVA